MAQDQGATFTGDRPRAAAPGALADRRELAFVALERTRMPIVITDARQPDHPIVVANQAFIDLTGYAAEEIIGRNCRFMQGPETSAQSLDEIRSAMAGRRNLVIELQNRRQDGSTFWNQLCISPIFDDRGELIYYFGSQLDVTERRRALDLEASEHRLLREVDHRAMNALALVQAIVRLSRTDSVERYAQLVQGRVGALARAHVTLARGGWNSASLQGLVNGELEVFRSTGTSGVEVGGEDVQVSVDQVQPLCLVLHEMVDDCARNGALSARGSLCVRCWTDRRGERIGLAWRERGGPPGAAGRHPDFSSSLVTTLVERQMKGALTWRRGSEGLEADLALAAG